MDNQKVSFLIEGYKAALDYYDGYMNRIWTRFNIMVTLDSALLALFLTLCFDKSTLVSEKLLIFPIVGFILSALMYAQSAQDKFVSSQYLLQINELKEHIASLLQLGKGDELPMLFSKTVDFRSGNKAFVFKGITSWRAAPISVTKIPALFSLLFAIAWATFGFLLR
jgi:hypothetical protein